MQLAHLFVFFSGAIVGKSLQIFSHPLGAVPTPSPQQLKYGGSISALIHFNMATFFHDGDPGCSAENWNGCDPLGGCNSSDPRSFNPTSLNVSNWIVSMLAINAEWGVLTAKHGCGFLLWETNTTLPDGSPYGYNVNSTIPVMKMFAEAATAAGLGYGWYYSLTNNFRLNEFGHTVKPPSTLLPGQANVTQAQYEDIALAQMTEIWQSFGNLTEVWLDGGCGDMCDKVMALLPQTLARNAVAFNGGGVSANAVRWCGTEMGNPAKGPGGAVWSTTDCGWCPDGSGSGSPPNASGALWYPSGIDTTLQQGDHWFYTPGDGIVPLSTLVTWYHNSVGSNGHLELDFAIDRTGQIDPIHAAAYAQFGAWQNSCYGKPLASASIPAGSSFIEFSLPLSPVSGTCATDRISMVEDQTLGQVVIDYTVEFQDKSGGWNAFSEGTTIGSKRIDVISAAVEATALRLTIVSAFSGNLPVTISVFSPTGCVVV